MIDPYAELKRIQNKDNNETFDQAFHSLEAIAGALGIGPSVGLWMFGIVDATQVASPTDIIVNNLQQVPNDLLEGQFYMQVLYNTSAVGAPPEGQIRKITNFVQGGALQTFTTDAFGADVEAGDMVCIIHECLISPDLELISTIIKDTFELVNAELTTTETGGTLTTTGAEQTVYTIAAPAGVFEPLIIQIAMTNLALGITVRVRTFALINPAAALVPEDEYTFVGPCPPAQRLKNIILRPNRFGYEVTLEQIVGAPGVDFDWGVVNRL